MTMINSNRRKWRLNSICRAPNLNIHNYDTRQDHLSQPDWVPFIHPVGNLFTSYVRASSRTWSSLAEYLLNSIFCDFNWRHLKWLTDIDAEYHFVQLTDSMILSRFFFFSTSFSLSSTAVPLVASECELLHFIPGDTPSANRSDPARIDDLRAQVERARLGRRPHRY